MENVLVPIFVVGGLWVMIAAIWVSAIVANSRNTKELHDTMRRAIEAGQQLSPDTIAMLQKPTRTWEQDLRSGIILVALAGGLTAAGFVGGAVAGSSDGIEVGGSPHGFLVAGIIVGAIGVGQLVSAWLRRDRKA